MNILLKSNCRSLFHKNWFVPPVFSQSHKICLRFTSLLNRWFAFYFFKSPFEKKQQYIVKHLLLETAVIKVLIISQVYLFIQLSFQNN